MGRMTAVALAAPADLRGSTMPRLWTRPLVPGPPGPCGCGCALTPETSYGFAVIRFARVVLREPLDPWQAWLVIHAGELLRDGRPRFRTVLLLVARQNGKTEVCKILMLYWMYVECWELMLGTSTKLSYAAETWTKAWKQAKRNPTLVKSIPRDGIRRTNGEQCFTALNTMVNEDGEEEEYESRYQIAASNDEGGRSLSIDRLLQDELRHHYSWDAWDAAVFAQNARPHAQNFGVSNAGSDKSTVLNSLRDSALTFTEWWDEHGNAGVAEILASGAEYPAAGDWRLGIFEWSAPDGCDIEDPAAWTAANPNLGHRLDRDTIAGAAARAKAKGGKEEASFRTEVLCQRVKAMDAAIDPAKWGLCSQPGTLDAARRRLAVVFDLSPDGLHATLAVAGVVEPGIVRVELVEAWDGSDCATTAAAQLPALIAKIRPRIFGWFPTGPAASMIIDLGKVRRPGWPVRGVRVEEIKTDVYGVCMGLAKEVLGERIRHTSDPLGDAHILPAEKLYSGARWVFSRKGGHCDAAYAIAGAVHLARSLPASPSATVPASAAVRDELARQRAIRQAAATGAEPAAE